MVVVPMQNAGQRCFLQFFQGELYAQGTKAYFFCRFAKPEHAAAIADSFAQGSELLQRYVFTVVFGYYPQAGGTAVFGVGLAVVGEGFQTINQK